MAVATARLSTAEYERVRTGPAEPAARFVVRARPVGNRGLCRVHWKRSERFAQALTDWRMGVTAPAVNVVTESDHSQTSSANVSHLGFYHARAINHAISGHLEHR
jgi:hypothetical protein